MENLHPKLNNFRNKYGSLSVELQKADLKIGFQLQLQERW